MDKKGLNFIVGIIGLFVIYKLWASGFLHQSGFMLADNTFSTELNGTMKVCGDGHVMYDTPLAAFASVVIDAIAVFGALLVTLSTGIWQAGGVLMVYLGDLFKLGRFYIDQYMDKNNIPKEKPLPEPETGPEPVKEDTTVEIGSNQFLVEMLEVISELDKKVNALSEKQEPKEPKSE